MPIITNTKAWYVKFDIVYDDFGKAIFSEVTIRVYTPENTTEGMAVSYAIKALIQMGIDVDRISDFISCRPADEQSVIPLTPPGKPPTEGG
jgi:hypothetical protein